MTLEVTPELIKGDSGVTLGLLKDNSGVTPGLLKDDPGGESRVTQG